MNSLPKVKTLTVTGVEGTGETTLTISKMPLGRYATFLTELAKIPKTLSGIVKLFFDQPDATKVVLEGAVEDGVVETKPAKQDEISDEQFLEIIMSLPDILVNNWEDLIKLLHIASGIPEEEVRKLDLDEAVQVVVVVIEVNNFFGIKDRYQTLLEKVAISEQQKKAAIQKKK